jgi:FkbM family methyltransferase
MKTNYEFMNTHGKNPGITAKVICNKIVYSLARSLMKAPPDGWLQSRWHWFRSPFSLRRQVLWSKPLNAWFRPEDESALECMLHLPSYEPVDWVAPKPGEVFLDIGAYIGWYTIQASGAVGPSGRVIALEPDATNRRQLEYNISLNGLSNCFTVPKAAWEHNEKIGWHSSAVPVWHKADVREGANLVQAITVDSLVNELGLKRVDWIKMDIEGGEIEALRGAARTLELFSPVLFVEVHETMEPLTRSLTKSGYKVGQAKFDQPPDHHGWVVARRV